MHYSIKFLDGQKTGTKNQLSIDKAIKKSRLRDELEVGITKDLKTAMINMSKYLIKMLEMMKFWQRKIEQGKRNARIHTHTNKPAADMSIYLSIYLCH